MDRSRRFNPDDGQKATPDGGAESIVILGIEGVPRLSLLDVISESLIAETSVADKQLRERERAAKSGEIKPPNVTEAIVLAAQINAARRMINQILSRVN